MKMKTLCKTSLVALLFASFASLSLPAHARPEKTEEQLIHDLDSAKEGDVADALQKLEKQFPTSKTMLPAIKKKLDDSRPKVRRKAARVLGAIHAPVDKDDVKKIDALLKSSDAQEITDGLKALRGLEAPSAVPDILPLLKHPTPNIKRDACRTLAVLGDKSNVKDIEPLLQDPVPAVQADAQDAIFKLKAKS
ncbi:MAG: HEAT repeat domain-containing protein [Verrucomicrobiota bacterium]